jgi:hypothetical protein
LVSEQYDGNSNSIREVSSLTGDGEKDSLPDAYYAHVFCTLWLLFLLYMNRHTSFEIFYWTATLKKSMFIMDELSAPPLRASLTDPSLFILYILGQRTLLTDPSYWWDDPSLFILYFLGQRTLLTDPSYWWEYRDCYRDRESDEASVEASFQSYPLKIYR